MKSTKILEPKVVVIGGGTGSFTLLQGLKKYTSSITALVNMSDDGGSSGVLRDELGVLPPGDVRQCLVALSNTPRLRELFSYRFAEGGLKGHTFGNIFLSAVEKMAQNFDSAVQLASEVLQITGKVIPVTNDNSHLVLHTKDGKKIVGEHAIGKIDFKGEIHPTLSLQPVSKLHPKAKQALAEADIVVIAPGNLYGSLAPALLVDGMKTALSRTSAKVIYVSNLVTKPGQTDGFMVHDFVAEIERFAGKGTIDYVFFNTDEPPRNTLDRYVREKEHIVEFDLDRMAGASYIAIGMPLVARSKVEYDVQDTIAAERSLIRHDSERVAKEVMRIFFA